MKHTMLMLEESIHQKPGTIILKSHPYGMYPGATTLLNLWQKMLVDPTKRRHDFAIIISTSVDLLADQRQIGKFIRDNSHRISYLSISGHTEIFRLDPFLIGTSYTNLKGLEVVFTGIGQRYFPGIPKDLLPKSLAFLNLEGCSISWATMNYTFEAMNTLRLHNLHGKANASNVFNKIIRPSEHMLVTLCLDRSLVDFVGFDDWFVTNDGQTCVGIHGEVPKMPRYMSLGPSPVLLDNTYFRNDSDQTTCSDDDEDDDDDDFALLTQPHFDQFHLADVDDSDWETDSDFEFFSEYDVEFTQAV